MTFYPDLGKRIRRYRMLRGLSQSQLGAAIGVTFQQFQKYESGKNHLRIDAFLKLASAMGLSPMELLSDTPESIGPELRRQDLALYAALSRCSVRQKRAITELLGTFA